MRLDLREIILVPGSQVPFDCELETERLDFPAVKAYRAKPRAQGRVYNEAGVLHLEGTLNAEMTCYCDRCGTEFDTEKVTELDAIIVEEENEEYPEPGRCRRCPPSGRDSRGSGSSRLCPRRRAPRG